METRGDGDDRVPIQEIPKSCEGPAHVGLNGLSVDGDGVLRWIEIGCHIAGSKCRHQHSAIPFQKHSILNPFVERIDHVFGLLGLGAATSCRGNLREVPAVAIELVAVGVELLQILSEGPRSAEP